MFLEYRISDIFLMIFVCLFTKMKMNRFLTGVALALGSFDSDRIFTESDRDSGYGVSYQCISGWTNTICRVYSGGIYPARKCCLRGCVLRIKNVFYFGTRGSGRYGYCSSSLHVYFRTKDICKRDQSRGKHKGMAAV